LGGVNILSPNAPVNKKEITWTCRYSELKRHVVALNHAVEPLSLGTRLFLFRRNDISLSHESGSQPKFVKPLAGREAIVRLHFDFFVSMRFHIHRQTGCQLATPGQTSCM